LHVFTLHPVLVECGAGLCLRIAWLKVVIEEAQKLAVIRREPVRKRAPLPLLPVETGQIAVSLVKQSQALAELVQNRTPRLAGGEIVQHLNSCTIQDGLTISEGDRVPQYVERFSVA